MVYTWPPQKRAGPLRLFGYFSAEDEDRIAAVDGVGEVRCFFGQFFQYSFGTLAFDFGHIDIGVVDAVLRFYFEAAN